MDRAKLRGNGNVVNKDVWLSVMIDNHSNFTRSYGKVIQTDGQDNGRNVASDVAIKKVSNEHNQTQEKIVSISFDFNSSSFESN